MLPLCIKGKIWIECNREQSAEVNIWIEGGLNGGRLRKSA
jgi:hypothetical protein